MPPPVSTIHASAVLIGTKAVLIRGPSGAGKSSLAWEIIRTSRQKPFPFTRLVGDDRIHVEACAGRLLVRPSPVLAGLIEIRNLGIRRVPYESIAVVDLVVDLAAADAMRHPIVMATEIAGVTLPRVALANGSDGLAAISAFLTTQAATN
jgi:serine kinase of HPr protein (carbohydrate metabolism regulator)